MGVACKAPFSSCDMLLRHCRAVDLRNVLQRTKRRQAVTAAYADLPPNARCPLTSIGAHRLDRSPWCPVARLMFPAGASDQCRLEYWMTREIPKAHCHLSHAPSKRFRLLGRTLGRVSRRLHSSAVVHCSRPPVSRRPRCLTACVSHWELPQRGRSIPMVLPSLASLWPSLSTHSLISSQQALRRHSRHLRPA